MSSPAADTSKTPREIGREMLRLREQFNLTPQEVAERIHIRPRYITAIEEGRYDQLPGKVYARGYIQTYAEFLGMDVAKTIAHCFASEQAAGAPMAPPPARTIGSIKPRSRSYGPVGAVLAVLAVSAVALYGQTNTSDVAASEPVAPNVVPVPEAMLATMRNAVMPTAANYECLTTESSLGCFYTGAASQLLSQLTHSNRLPYVGEIDVSEWLIAPEMPLETVEETTPSESTAPVVEEAQTHVPTITEMAADTPAPEANAAPVDEATPEAAANE